LCPARGRDTRATLRGFYLDAGEGNDVLASSGGTDLCDGAGGAGEDIADFSCEVIPEES